MPILSRTVLCGAIVACLSSTATAETAVQLTRRGVEQYSYRHRHSSVVMVAVLLVLIIFTAIFIFFWHRSRRDEKDFKPRHAWQDLEKQKGLHDAPFQTIDLNDPAPVVHSTKKDLCEPAPVVHSKKKDLCEPAPVVHSKKRNRATDTWDKYLSMIKSPSRLNSIVGKMSTSDKN